MGKTLSAEVDSLGPVRAEYKNNPAQYGLVGSAAIVLMLFLGIQMCRSTLSGVSSQGINAVFNSPQELVCGPLALMIGATGIFLWLIRITSRVIVHRDGFVFRRRFPPKVDVWRWEDIDSVSHMEESNPKSSQTFHSTIVRGIGQPYRSVTIEAMLNMETLQMTIDSELDRVRKAEESQAVRSGAARTAVLSNTHLEQQENETILAIFDMSQFIEGVNKIWVSPDNRHIAYTEFVRQRFRVTLDQQVGETFQGIDLNSPTFSPDSSRLAYLAGNAPDNYLIVDGRKYGPYQEIIDCSPQFSPDSQKIAYASRDIYKVTVYVDEDAVFKADLVGDSLVFSPDSQSCAFRAGIGTRQCIVVDGQQGPSYDQVDNPHFSPDGQRLAYAARQDEEWFIVVDGEEGPRFKDAVEPVFSPDSKRIAYYAQAEKGRYLVVDGKMIGPHFTFGQAPFGMFSFSPDSQRFAYVVQEAKKTLGLRHGHTELVVVDGRRGQRRQRCGNLIFSPNSDKLGYLAYADKKWFVIIDEEIFGPFQDIRDDSPVFSPDSETHAFSGKDLGLSSVYINGEAVASYQMAYSPIFGPNGKHFVYGALDGDDWRVVIDNKPGKRYKVLMCGDQACVAFDSSDQLHYIASRKEAPDHWLLVSETI